MKLFLKIFALTVFCTSLSHAQSVDSVVAASLRRIGALKCFTLRGTHYSSKGKDTILIKRYDFKESVADDKRDPVLGSSFRGWFKDTAQIELDYHSPVEVRYSWKDSTYRTDTLNLSAATIGLVAPVPYQVKALFSYIQAKRESVDCQIRGTNPIEIHVEFKNLGISFANMKPFIVRTDTLHTEYSVWLDRTMFPVKVRSFCWQTVQDDISSYAETPCDASSPGARSFVIPYGFVLADPHRRNAPLFSLEGKLAPKWTLERLDGSKISSSETAGKVVLLEFTGIGCGPCKEAVPFLNNIHRKFDPKAFRILSVESWVTDGPQVKDYIHANAIEYEYVLANDAVSELFHIKGFPTFILIGKDGIVKKVKLGYDESKKEADLETEIQKLLSS